MEHTDSIGGGGLITDGATQWRMTADANISFVTSDQRLKRAALSVGSEDSDRSRRQLLMLGDMVVARSVALAKT